MSRADSETAGWPRDLGDNSVVRFQGPSEARAACDLVAKLHAAQGRASPLVLCEQAARPRSGDSCLVCCGSVDDAAELGRRVAQFCIEAIGFAPDEAEEGEPWGAGQREGTADACAVPSAGAAARYLAAFGDALPKSVLFIPLAGPAGDGTVRFPPLAGRFRLTSRVWLLATQLACALVPTESGGASRAVERAAAAAAAFGEATGCALTEAEQLALFPAVTLALARCASTPGLAAAAACRSAVEALAGAPPPSAALAVRASLDVRCEMGARVRPRPCAPPPACGRLTRPGQRDRAAHWIARARARGELAAVCDARLDARTPRLDLSAANAALAGVDVFDAAAFTAHIRAQLPPGAPMVALGQFDEDRAIYRSPLFRALGEPRTVHLGIDVFLEAGAPVYAVADAIVHSSANNANALDYGPTVVLKHRTQDGDPLFALYGHLSVASLAGKVPGAEVGRGTLVGWVGGPDVNGGWPPHLHFQLQTDMLGLWGDFPGVCAATERERWLLVCVDPAAALGVNPEP